LDRSQHKWGEGEEGSTGIVGYERGNEERGRNSGTVLLGLPETDT